MLGERTFGQACLRNVHLKRFTHGGGTARLSYAWISVGTPQETLILKFQRNSMAQSEAKARLVDMLHDFNENGRYHVRVPSIVT